MNRLRLTGRVDLGRPWRPYANVVYMNSYMDDHIRPTGWNNWGNTANEATANYGEYLSYGPGANPAARVTWTKQLTKDEATQYTVAKMLAGDDGWNPAAGTGLLNSNASLTGISVDGTPLPDFTKMKYDYIVTLPYGTIATPQVRAERSGQGQGRIYLITYTIKDLAGNQTIATTEVMVPHDNK